MSLGASELWRRRQAQFAVGREQLTPSLQEHQQSQQATDKEEKASEADSVAPLSNEAVVQGGSVAAVSQSATAAPASNSSAFVPPRPSPFAARQR